MRILRVLTPAMLLSGLSQVAASQSISGQLSRSDNDEILVTGRRGDMKYRLPPQFRTIQDGASDRWRDILKRDGSCQNVGPVGCGLQPNRLVTFGSDGTVQFGDPDSQK